MRSPTVSSDFLGSVIVTTNREFVYNYLPITMVDTYHSSYLETIIQEK